MNDEGLRDLTYKKSKKFFFFFLEEHLDKRAWRSAMLNTGTEKRAWRGAMLNMAVGNTSF